MNVDAHRVKPAFGGYVAMRLPRRCRDARPPLRASDGDVTVARLCFTRSRKGRPQLPRMGSGRGRE